MLANSLQAQLLSLFCSKRRFVARINMGSGQRAQMCQAFDKHNHHFSIEIKILDKCLEKDNSKNE